MAIDEDAVAVLAAKYAVMRQVADERTWRVYLGSEARALGYGGIAVVARAAGVSETMVAAGVSGIEAGELGALPPGRSRRAGGGRKKAEDAQPGLIQAVRGLLEAATRGIRWRRSPGARCRCGTSRASWPGWGSGAARTRWRG